VANTNRTMITLVTGALLSLAAMSASAGQWSDRTILSEVILGGDKTVLIQQHSGDWINPDACTRADAIMLLPPETQGGLEGYKEMYATLLAAHLMGREVRIFIEGCTSVGAQTYPVFSQLTVYGPRVPGRYRDGKKSSESLN